MLRARDAVCRNPECQWRDEPRRIAWPKAGPGMILQGTLVCSCEWHMELIPDEPAESNWDRLGPEGQRQRWKYFTRTNRDV